MAKLKNIQINSPMSPPEWALLERELLKVSSEACEEFYKKYFDERGYLNCVARWSANDGPDDAAENFLNWTMLHALGGDDKVLEMYKKAWEGHIRQYTELKTVETELFREGVYYKEFPAMFDWMHTGEGLSAFTLQGLSDPYDPDYKRRISKYTGFYMNEDPGADNYDPKHRIIKSLFNGSRGPLLRKSIPIDWAGDPVEVENRFYALHGEENYEQMLKHFEFYNDVVGDHPLNLNVTALAVNAYMLTGENKYRNWVLEYVDAWVERTEKNGGLIPSNVGLDGVIGSECDGKWYGGVYGWSHTRYGPKKGEIAHNAIFLKRSYYGFANAFLLTGDRKYLNVWANMLDIVNSNSKKVNGEILYPHMYGDKGWYHYTSQKASWGAEELYFWLMDKKILDLVPERTDAGSYTPGMDPEAQANTDYIPGYDQAPGKEWVDFLEGNNPEFPVKVLRRDLEELRSRMKGMYEDFRSLDTRMSDNTIWFNPVITDGLITLMLGGLPTGVVGYQLHSRLRYFDIVNRRAGLPEGVAALVEGITDTETIVTLVNLNLSKLRKVVVQSGAYGEHHIENVNVGEARTDINENSFIVELAPGCGQRLHIKIDRYKNNPTFNFPFD